MGKQITLKDAISIGIGGMVGGGIFAVLGLAVSLAKGGTPVAFLFAGIIALLTAYSYAKLSRKFPENGGGRLGLCINNLETEFLQEELIICFG